MKILKSFRPQAGLYIAALLALCCALPFSASAQLTDGYTSQQDETTTTNFNQVVFPGVATKVIRLTAFDVNADTNIADLHIFAGTTPYTVTGIINSTNLTVTSNAGIITNRLVILQFGNSNWVATVNHTNNLTNIFLAGGATLGLTVPTNATLWNCTNRAVIRVPTGRTALAGQALFAAQVRAPLAIRLTPSLQNSNRVHAAVKYGSYDAAVSTE